MVACHRLDPVNEASQSQAFIRMLLRRIFIAAFTHDFLGYVNNC